MISNIKKDQVGATVAGIGLVGLSVATAGGIPAIMGMGAGGVIGGSANATMQYPFTGSVDPKDVAMGVATGALTYGTALLPSLTELKIYRFPSKNQNITYTTSGVQENFESKIDIR